MANELVTTTENTTAQPEQVQTLPESVQKLINEVTSTPHFYNGQRVLMLDTVDRIHGTKDAAWNAFKGHREQFKEGIDYARVPYVVWSQWVNDSVQETESKTGGYRGEKIAVTRTGYMLLVKPMRDPLAW